MHKILQKKRRTLYVIKIELEKIQNLQKGLIVEFF